MNECWLGYLLNKYGERRDEAFCLVGRVKSLYVVVITLAGQKSFNNDKLLSDDERELLRR